MKRTQITAILELCERHIPHYNKGDVIACYEGVYNFINVIDSAYPIGWSRQVRELLGVNNIGMWGWAYTDEVSGYPVPCCRRALAYLDVLIGMESPLVRREMYYSDYRIEYETPEGEVKRSGAKGYDGNEALARFAKRKLGVVRDIQLVKKSIPTVEDIKELTSK